MNYTNLGNRQVPSIRAITTEKDYCDLLYAYIQCNSERIGPTTQGRKIAKSKVKFLEIERAFTKIIDGVEEKTMTRYSIAKYFKKLIEMNLLYEDDNDKKYYYLTVLEPDEANLIDYRTLEQLMNVMQRYSISIYVYLYNRFFANTQQAYTLTLSQVKDFIGIATSTTSNNYRIVCTFDILQRLGLLSFELVWKDGMSFYQINWVKNKLFN